MADVAVVADEAPGLWRLFFAFPVPGDAADRLEASLAAYVRAFPGARWQRPDAFHVTARFLGATPPGRVPGLVEVMAACGATSGPIAMSTGAASGIPRGAGSVAWLTLDVGSAAAAVVSHCLEDAVPFRPVPPPHLTVARRVDAPLIQALVGETLGPVQGDWVADRLVLYRSHTGTPAGSRYEPLAEVYL